MAPEAEEALELRDRKRRLRLEIRSAASALTPEYRAEASRRDRKSVV